MALSIACLEKSDIPFAAIGCIRLRTTAFICTGKPFAIRMPCVAPRNPACESPSMDTGTLKPAQTVAMRMDADTKKSIGFNTSTPANEAVGQMPVYAYALRP